MNRTALAVAYEKRRARRAFFAPLAERLYWPPLQVRLETQRMRARPVRVSPMFALQVHKHVSYGSLRWRMQEAGRINRGIGQEQSKE